MSVQVPKGYKQTEVGVIPEDWTISPIGDVATTGSGTTPSRALYERYFKNGNINWVKTLDLNNSAIKTTDEQVTEFALSETSLKIYPVNTVLIAMYGGFNQIGRTGVLAVPACVNQALTAVKVGSKINSKYLLYTLNYKNEYWKSVASSSRKDPNITSKDIKDFLLAFPCPQEQQAIAEALSDADALIESLEQLIAKKRQIKQGAMQELLTGQRRLPGFSGGWKVNRLGDLTQMCSGGTPPSSNPDFYNGQIPWVSISDMTSAGKYIASTEKNLTNEGFASCAAKMFPSGTVLYAMYASLGECSIANVSLCTSQAILGIQPGEKIDGEYLYYYLQFIKNSVKNMGQQGTQANLNKGMVGDFLLKTPSISEQKSIVEVLHEMDKEISNIEQRLSKSRKIKQSMMQELLTGRIRLI